MRMAYQQPGLIIVRLLVQFPILELFLNLNTNNDVEIKIMRHFFNLNKTNWKSGTLSRQFAPAVFLLGILFMNSPQRTQLPYRVIIPGNTFSAEGLAKDVTVEEVPGGGRRFRGKAGVRINLRATLPMPPLSKVAEYNLQRIAIHFRTETSGPSLRLVEIRNGNQTVFLKNVNLQGDYSTKELINSEYVNNTWVLSDPIKVYAQSVIRLEIQFPIGFDSPINPGEFLLSGITIDFPGKDIQIKRRNSISVGNSPIERKDSTKPKDFRIKRKT